MITILFIFLFAFESCEKDKTEEHIIGYYKLKGARINGENVLNLLQNDSITLYRLFVGGENNNYKLLFKIKPAEGSDWIYSSFYDLLQDNTLLRVRKKYWDGPTDDFLNYNVAMYPFSKQDVIDFTVLYLSETELFFETNYLNKTYYYEFEKE
ncbi:MAG: hypothetical protein B7C24_06050 [Bacteroidetes bacterium 4572_77]|nr:MAG: hypothetical protein B7C24_06050 [Bacteroidetes bacterium 4572_77]